MLTEVGDLQDSRVLDFGCGSGHLATFLKERGVRCRYTGVEIVDEFLPFARGKHPEHRFGRWEEFRHERFDYVFVSGVFNNRIPDNESFLVNTTRALFGQCEQALSFNLMSTYVDFQDPGLWYASPERVFSMVKEFTPYVTLRNDYVVKEVTVPFEFAVYAYRRPRAAFAAKVAMAR
jgi:SAM-dependent methyltransferase